MAARLGFVTLLASTCTLGVGVAFGQTTSAPAASQPTSQCYVGPIEVRVVNPDGKPAANIQVGVFGASWFQEAAEGPPVHRPQRRTDESGRFRLGSKKECMAPTLFYAWDECRHLAGFCLIERLDKLAQPQTVRLEPARWVTGRIVSSEADQRGSLPEYVAAGLTPIKNAVHGDRNLRFVLPPAHTFRFLVPPGEYRIFLYGLRLEQKTVDIRVLPASTPLNLGTYDLGLSPLARLTGKPAPDWDVAEWSDGKSRKLGDLRGRPVLLGFWQNSPAAANALQRAFNLHTRLATVNVAVILIHAPEPGGLAAVQRYLNENVRSDSAAAALDLDMTRWPFPCGIDRPARSGAQLAPGFPLGQSEEPYGRIRSQTFILIDRDGRIVADSRMREEQWEAALEGATRPQNLP